MAPTALFVASLNGLWPRSDDGRRFRTLTVVDIFTRECLDIVVGQRLRATDVVATLEQLRFSRGVPKRIYCDNRLELVSGANGSVGYANGLKVDFSRRGKPTNNAIIESFNGRFREECPMSIGLNRRRAPKRKLPLGVGI